MKRKIDVIVANSSGNITIMVLTPVERNEYIDVARKLLDMNELNGEQVAFLLKDGRMEMCGLEFCGNASRAFALYKAQSMGLFTNKKNEDEVAVDVSVSGCNHPLSATVSTSGDVEMDMPIPTDATPLTASQIGLEENSCSGLLVNLDGISHLIIEGVNPSAETFETIKDHIYKLNPQLPAFGVMFYDSYNGIMTPVVYVKNVDTTYFEGSCASGTVAASYALSLNKENGIINLTMKQPAGVLYSRTKKEHDQIKEIKLKGHVHLSDIITIML